jgi:hypothetical protein
MTINGAFGSSRTKDVYANSTAFTFLFNKFM